MRSLKWVASGRLFWINCVLPYNRETIPKRSTWHGNCADYRMKKVIELIRVSTEAQAATDRASIPAQRAVNRRTCVQYGLEIVRSIELWTFLVPACCSPRKLSNSFRPWDRPRLMVLSARV